MYQEQFMASVVRAARQYKFTRGTLVLSAFTVLALSACDNSTETATAPAGESESVTTQVLEAGATLLQGNSPLDPINVYLVGFHPMKDDSSHQMEAHHFCNQVNEEFAQCVLFDGNTRDANMNGIEYIISEASFNSLPEDEKQYWHPHNYEILSGQLLAPGIPDIAEKELMRGKMNSYGKTWHLWNSGSQEMRGDELPLGPPMLAWSFNRDGEAEPGLVERRDERLNIDSTEMREKRADLVELARPQMGVDAIRDQFPNAAPNMPGVSDSAPSAQQPGANEPAPVQ
jgi:hypothetical protein